MIVWEILNIWIFFVYYILLINYRLFFDKFYFLEWNSERNYDFGFLINRDKLFGKVEMMEILRESDNVKLEFVIG